MFLEKGGGGTDFFCQLQVQCNSQCPRKFRQDHRLCERESQLKL